MVYFCAHLWYNYLINMNEETKDKISGLYDEITVRECQIEELNHEIAELEETIEVQLQIQQRRNRLEANASSR